MGLVGFVRDTVLILAFFGLCCFGLLMVLAGMMQGSMATVGVGLISFIAPIGVTLLISMRKHE